MLLSQLNETILIFDLLIPHELFSLRTEYDVCLNVLLSLSSLALKLLVCWTILAPTHPLRIIYNQFSILTSLFRCWKNQCQGCHNCDLITSENWTCISCMCGWQRRVQICFLTPLKQVDRLRRTDILADVHDCAPVCSLVHGFECVSACVRTSWQSDRTAAAAVPTDAACQDETGSQLERRDWRAREVSAKEFRQRRNGQEYVRLERVGKCLNKTAAMAPGELTVWNRVRSKWLWVISPPVPPPPILAS